MQLFTNTLRVTNLAYCYKVIKKAVLEIYLSNVQIYQNIFKSMLKEKFINALSFYLLSNQDNTLAHHNTSNTF